LFGFLIPSPPPPPTTTTTTPHKNFHVAGLSYGRTRSPTRLFQLSLCPSCIAFLIAHCHAHHAPVRAPLLNLQVAAALNFVWDPTLYEVNSSTPGVPNRTADEAQQVFLHDWVAQQFPLAGVDVATVRPSALRMCVCVCVCVCDLTPPPPLPPTHHTLYHYHDIHALV
jgi:hypothetical protein